MLAIVDHNEELELNRSIAKIHPLLSCCRALFFGSFTLGLSSMVRTFDRSSMQSRKHLMLELSPALAVICGPQELITAIAAVKIE